MKAAIYSRFSTDRQNESSIGDQVRVCIEHAQRQGRPEIDNLLFYEPTVVWRSLPDSNPCYALEGTPHFSSGRV